ncbi:MAG TPA: SDR family oxidoreductase [Polyangiaceae bacterium]|nr:SDR family oxidoreductase [Polyangiaceae bacterium]
MIADYRGKAVLVTGGTAGIGLATALEFGRCGAECTLTYRFGSADEDDVRRRFAEAGAPPPFIVQADASSEEETGELLRTLRTRHGSIEALVINVSAALVTHSVDDYDRRGLLKSIEASAWPLVSYVRGVRDAFGKYPRYVIGMSSTGVSSFASGYDFVAASKAVMETLARYMSVRLYDEDVRINVIRSRSIVTTSFESTFGKEFFGFAKRFCDPEKHFLSPEEVGEAALALASGMMDGVRGQVLTVDRGTTFFDDFMRVFDERDRYGL